MGTGSSRVRKVNQRIQVPTPTKARTRTPSPPVIRMRPTYSYRPHSAQSSSWITKLDTQNLQSNRNSSHYDQIWEQNGKLSSAFEQLIRSGSTNIQHEQNEIRTTENETKHSTQYKTAQVDSILTSHVETIHTLSTSDKLDQLFLNLKQTQLDFDESVKRRIGQITNETESILAQIVEETQLTQQDLLIRAKEQQTIQDEQYRILLEDFIVQLNDKRAKQLAFIQQQLQEQRLQIFNQSQLKMQTLNEQANSLKTHIMSTEEIKASQKIDSIIKEIHSISKESAIHSIGTQIKTNFNLTLNQTVGSTNNQTQYDQNIKRTIYIQDNNRNRTSSPTQSAHFQTKSIQQMIKQNPTNPKNKS